MYYYCKSCGSVREPVNYVIIQGFEVPKLSDCVCEICIGNGYPGKNIVLCTRDNCGTCAAHTISIPILEKIELPNGSRWVVHYMCNICKSIK
jgi:hypothetical protein